jgi:2-polyprenyl-6-methoxyphenol hydroxylase-like FAD-dependent oxidoreductase
VSKHTEDLLRSIGAWDNLQLDRVHRYDRMDVWESHGSGTLAFEDASLGHIIEYDNLVQALAKCVADRGMYTAIVID